MARQAEIRQREREMEMAHEKEMAIIHKEPAEAGHNGSVNEGDGIPTVTRCRPLPCFNENTLLMFIFSFLNVMPRIRAWKKIIMQFF